VVSRVHLDPAARLVVLATLPDHLTVLPIPSAAALAAAPAHHAPLLPAATGAQGTTQSMSTALSFASYSFL
jgi:hypothetical protein